MENYIIQVVLHNTHVMRISYFFRQNKQNLRSIIKVKLYTMRYAGQSITVNLPRQDFLRSTYYLRGTISRHSGLL